MRSVYLLSLKSEADWPDDRDVVTHRQQVVRGAVRSEHVVQLFDAPDSLATNVAAFLAQGLADNANLLVVARPAHAEAIKSALAAAGYSPDMLLGSGTLVALDAHDTLRRFMRNQMPDPDLFDAVVGDLVRRLAAASPAPLRVYGEMVDLLAEQRNFAAAEELETHWTRLSETTSFSLLCGYASSHFAAEDGAGRLATVCGLHTRVHQSNEDLLANWLLSSRN